MSIGIKAELRKVQWGLKSNCSRAALARLTKAEGSVASQRLPISAAQRLAVFFCFFCKVLYWVENGVLSGACCDEASGSEASAYKKFAGSRMNFKTTTTNWYAILETYIDVKKNEKLEQKKQSIFRKVSARPYSIFRQNIFLNNPANYRADGRFRFLFFYVSLSGFVSFTN